MINKKSGKTQQTLRHLWNFCASSCSLDAHHITTYAVATITNFCQGELIEMSETWICYSDRLCQSKALYQHLLDAR